MSPRFFVWHNITLQSGGLPTSLGWYYGVKCKYLQDVVIVLLGFCGPPSWRYVLTDVMESWMVFCIFFSSEVKMFDFVPFEKEVHIFRHGLVTLTYCMWLCVQCWCVMWFHRVVLSKRLVVPLFAFGSRWPCVVFWQQNTTYHTSKLKQCNYINE